MWVARKQIALECTIGKKQARRVSVMLWVMFCLGIGIHVDVNLIHTTYLNIIVNQRQPLIAMVFPNGSGILCPATLQKLRNMTELNMLTWSPISPDLNLIKHVWDVLQFWIAQPVCPIYGDLCNLQRSAAIFLVTDTTTHLQSCCGVHGSMGQRSCYCWPIQY